MNESYHTYKWVMSYPWMCTVRGDFQRARMNESCYTYEWVMSHVWMNHGAHLNESSHICEWVISHMWMGHVKYMNVCSALTNLKGHTFMGYLTNESFMSHKVISHVAHTNNSCHIYAWVISHICMCAVQGAVLCTNSYVWHGSFICVTRPIHMCDMTHSYVWHDPFICVTRPIHMCDSTHSYVWHDPFICVTRPIHMCDTTHSYVWHDPFTCVTWLIGICDMTDLYVWHDWLIRNMTWLIHVCVMTHVTYESWPFSVHAKGAVTHIYEKVTQIIYEKKVQVAHSVDAKGAHIICVTRKEQSHTYMTWNYGFLLQKSPMKETIFCKRDVSYYMCDTFGAVTHIYDLTAFKKPSYRVAKTHRIPYLYRLFSPKVTYI